MDYYEEHNETPPPRTRAGSQEHEQWLELTREEIDCEIEGQKIEDKNEKAVLNVYLKKVTDTLTELEADLKRNIAHAEHAKDCQAEFLEECKIVDEWQDETIDFAEDASFMDWQTKIDNLKHAADLLNRARYLVEAVMED